jgi:hypothetical protein
MGIKGFILGEKQTASELFKRYGIAAAIGAAVGAMWYPAAWKVAAFAAAVLAFAFVLGCGAVCYLLWGELMGEDDPPRKEPSALKDALLFLIFVAVLYFSKDEDDEASPAKTMFTKMCMSLQRAGRSIGLG